jgi:hypothetical protein
MDDIKHLAWLFRNMVKQACIGDFHEAREAWIWIVMHLLYKSKKM